MSREPRAIKLLVLAPNVDATDVGEAFVAYKWINALAKLTDLTLLSFHRPGRPDPSSQLPAAQVVSWPEPVWALKHERLNAMLKPAWPVYARYVRKWLHQAGKQGLHFDLAHQLMPQAARYASPLRNAGIPYVIGPLGGALDTPEPFRTEATNAPLFTRLRALDAFRFRHDPWLRASYSNAHLILGVAPYVAAVLADVPIKRFEPVLELGADDVEAPSARPQEPNVLRLLHVGRGVRTKGLRDSVRALAQLKDLPGVTLTSAGDGEEIPLCRDEAERLGVADRVEFLGRLPRADIEALYASHDVFCFPSFREPAGGVLYEAMRHGLPVITAACGGPDWIVDTTCGIRVPVTDPEDFAAQIAAAVRRLACEPALRARLGAGALAKIEREGLWPAKAERMIDLYQSVIDASGS